MSQQINLGDNADQLSRINDGNLTDAEPLELVDDVAHAFGRSRRHEFRLTPDDVANDAEPLLFLEEAVLSHPVVVEDLRQILLRAIADDDQNVLLLSRLPRVFDRAGNGCAA